MMQLLFSAIWTRIMNAFVTLYSKNLDSKYFLWNFLFISFCPKFVLIVGKWCAKLMEKKYTFSFFKFTRNAFKNCWRKREREIKDHITHIERGTKWRASLSEMKCWHTNKYYFWINRRSGWLVNDERRTINVVQPAFFTKALTVRWKIRFIAKCAS